MFDIDGTLIESTDFDGECYVEAVKEITGKDINSNWNIYKNVTDSGILDEFLMHETDKKRLNKIKSDVKCLFIKKIQNYCEKNVVKPIDGAIDFLTEVKNAKGVSVSIATGGWLESAKIKLDAAGINYSGIPIASASDHFARMEIMKLAIANVGILKDSKITYFSDGSWDEEASQALGWNFILLGNKLESNVSIKNFNNINWLKKKIGM